MTTLPPAGWYLDPENNAQQRYWDGATWTEHRIAGSGVQPHVAPPTAPEPITPEPTAAEPIEHTVPIPAYTAGEPPPFIAHTATEPSKKPWFKTWWAIASAVLIVLFGIGVAFGDSSEEKKPLTVPSPTVVATTPAVPTPVAPTTEAVPTPPAPSPTPPKPAKATPSSQVGGSAGESSDSFVLPDESGKTLQAAQDDLQAVSGNPFFYSSSDDASGEGRMQILDSGWQVCSQTPAAGTRVTQDDDIVFHTVRVSEDCP